jgi:hypothetical protein
MNPAMTIRAIPPFAVRLDLPWLFHLRLTRHMVWATERAMTSAGWQSAGWLGKTSRSISAW